jgi:sulfate adenylyltransferase
MSETTQNVETIAPHGGRLVRRLAEGAEGKRLAAKAQGLPTLRLNRRNICDLEMIAVGAYSPLEGYVGRKDYESVLTTMRLSNGLPWSIPITLRVDPEEAARLKEGNEIALTAESGKPLAILHLEEKYTYDKKLAAKSVYGTDSAEHPGVQTLYQRGEVLLAGKVTVLELPPDREFLPYRFTPDETRALFAERGWKTVVGFQT